LNNFYSDQYVLVKKEEIKLIILLRIFSLFHIILTNLSELYIEFLCLKDK
jgi:hypothetical protein